MTNVNLVIDKIINYSNELLNCADMADISRNDDSCGVLCGIVRDCAYKMIDVAQKEKEKHINRGVWDLSE